jgi:uncharacterized membrane protein
VDSGLPRLLFTLLVIYAAFHFSYAYTHLPEVVASHFDSRGQVNGWQTKSAFFISVIFVGVIASVVGFGIPAIISVMPPALVNLPNKHYWLSPEHRAETIEFFKTHFAWLGCAILALAILSFDYAVQSNFHPEHPPNPLRMWYIIGTFIALALAGAIRLFTKFRRPPQTLPS